MVLFRLFKIEITFIDKKIISKNYASIPDEGSWGIFTTNFDIMNKMVDISKLEIFIA